VDEFIHSRMVKLVGVALGAVAFAAGISTSFVVGSFYLWWEESHRRHSIFESPHSSGYWVVRTGICFLAFVVLHVAFRLLRVWLLQPKWRTMFSVGASRVLVWTCYLLGAAPAVLIFFTPRGN
jgi:hypothetical protein